LCLVAIQEAFDWILFVPDLENRLL
jgi:hypothetical protein